MRLNNHQGFQIIFSRKALSLPLAWSAVAVLVMGQLSICALAQQDYSQIPDYNATGNIDEYSKYYEQGTQAFYASQYTQAIEAFEKALAVAPDPSLPAIYNNLATAYMRRGNYYHDRRQEPSALNDYRRGYFYLETAWPEGMERKELHDKNRKTAKENLNISYQNMGINPADKAKHLEMAKQLRMQGKFPEAIVEYAPR